MYYDELDYMLEDFEDDMDYDDYDDYDDDYDDYDDDYDSAMNEAYDSAMLEEAARKISMTVNKNSAKDKYLAYREKCLQRGKTPLPKSEWLQRREKALKAAKVAGLAAAATAATGTAVLTGQDIYARVQANKKFNRNHTGSFRYWGPTNSKKSLKAYKKKKINQYLDKTSWDRKLTNAVKKKIFKEDPELAMALYESGIQDPEMQMAFVEGYYSEY